MKLTSAGYTHQGHYRQRNEDAILVQAERGLWAVCDGMGGHEAGDYASSLIVDELSALELPRHAGASVQAIKACLADCNAKLQAHADEHGLGQIGATIVLLFLSGSRVTLLWAGDSRAYRLRDGQLRLMSDDHSYARELARSTGQYMAPDEPGAQAITRAVGATAELRLDCLVFEARPGDVWMLCSDGVSGSVDDAGMVRILSSDGDAAAGLVEAAMAGGSRDNCSAISIALHGSHFSAPSSSTEYM